MGADFTNVAIFCRKTNDALTFRRSVKSDHLHSPSRERHLDPRHEVLPQDFFANGQDEEGILRRNETDKVREGQQANAAGHWAVMRKSLPATFWESW